MAGSSDLRNNPFAALFESVDQAQQFSATAASLKPQTDASSPILEPESVQLAEVTPSKDDVDYSEELEEVDSALSQIFLICISPELSPKQSVCCVHLDDLHHALQPQSLLDLDSLEQAVFERLMIQNPSDLLLSQKGASSVDRLSAAEADPLEYLVHSYIRLCRKPVKDSVAEKCKSVILTNLKTCLSHPEVFGETFDVGKQMVSVLLDARGIEGNWILELLEEVSLSIHEDPDESLLSTFQPVLQHIHQKFLKEFTLGQGPTLAYCDLLSFFTRKEYLAEVLLAYIQPTDASKGRHYELTLLGSILSLSCLPSATGEELFFIKPSRFTRQDVESNEATIHQLLGDINEAVYQLILKLLKAGPKAKSKMMSWIGGFIHANKGRLKMYKSLMRSSHLPDPDLCSDKCALNFSAVMVKLTAPFAQPQAPKLLTVQPTYCLATRDAPDVVNQRNIHITGLDDTCLVLELPEDRCNEHPKPKDDYNFVSELFFLTHLALQIGFQTNNGRLLAINREIPRLQTSLQQMMEAQAAGQSNPFHEQLKNRIEKVSSEYLCLKSALSEPNLLENFLAFATASATYLSQLAACGDLSKFQQITFPLPPNAPPELSCIPEFVVENIIECMLFLKRFKDSVYELNGDKLEHLKTFVLVFMGSRERMNNPHLRARMAEALECLMPQTEARTLLMTGHLREQLFESHPLREHLAGSLLQLFVSIEMTGQGVEFEHKFNYRRPMYNIIHYIWDMDCHRKAFQMLADHAERHIDDPEAPLFLRFLNLLMNDAIFLLDEALMYMAQIKEKQREREEGALERLSPIQQQEAEANFQHLSMLARFHNMMGQDTIRTLSLITRHTPSICTHPVLVDRIAAMLNYFLLHLVGPKKKDLKVKDFESFEFRPQVLVQNICTIYTNLGDSTAFCQAVSRDGRSYSHELFLQAEKVLTKIMAPGEVTLRFVELGAHIKAIAEDQQAEEEALADAPDEFLDPIMGSLMTDPVLLPTSGQIVDKATIARHILSDQSDPFNREPLTMEMVKPATELKQKINDWMAKIKSKSSNSSS